MTRTEATLSSVIVLLVFACAVIVTAGHISNRLAADNMGALAGHLGYAFFIEPYYSQLDCSGEMGSFTPVVLFVVWLVTTGLIAKARRLNRRFRPAFLVIFPALAVCAFNGVFDTGDVGPAIEPAAVVALIGAVIYEISFAGRWSRISLAVITFGLCAAYGVNTGLGFWGIIVACTTMTVVQLVWSGIEMDVFGSTYAIQGRQFQYR
ncbi:MAG TPA: hypothetical protein VM223_15400 [Planctomycetota bacterium]|nr:hypothetical protein [Planctomycetota bacterium]